jgi:deoxycytidylate deaminase
MDDLISVPNHFRLARNISKLSTHYKQKMGAVIVVNGHPLSVGCNQSKTHPAAPYTGLHAEVQAIKCSGKTSLKGGSIFVYRRRKDGRVGMARPCKYCMEDLKRAGIKRVYYSTPEYPFWAVEEI